MEARKKVGRISSIHPTGEEEEERGDYTLWMKHQVSEQSWKARVSQKAKNKTNIYVNFKKIITE